MHQDSPQCSMFVNKNGQYLQGLVQPVLTSLGKQIPPALWIPRPPQGQIGPYSASALERQNSKHC